DAGDGRLFRIHLGDEVFLGLEPRGILVLFDPQAAYHGAIERAYALGGLAVRAGGHGFLVPQLSDQKRVLAVAVAGIARGVIRQGHVHGIAGGVAGVVQEGDHALFVVHYVILAGAFGQDGAVGKLDLHAAAHQVPVEDVHGLEIEIRGRDRGNPAARAERADHGDFAVLGGGNVRRVRQDGIGEGDIVGLEIVGVEK